MKKELLLHRIFRISIIIKGIDGLLELLGGLALFVTRSQSLETLLRSLFTQELGEDPKDILVSHLLAWAQQAGQGLLSFLMLYLLVHGIIKLAIVATVWFEKPRTLIAASILLGAFLVYELLRFMQHHAVFLLGAILFDVVILLLMVREYRHMRVRHQRRKSSAD